MIRRPMVVLVALVICTSGPLVASGPARHRGVEASRCSEVDDDPGRCGGFEHAEAGTVVQPEPEADPALEVADQSDLLQGVVAGCARQRTEAGGAALPVRLRRLEGDGQ